MNQSSESNSGFSKQQKQELVEIVGEVVEQKVAPYFNAIQEDLQRIQETQSHHSTQLLSLKTNVTTLKEDVSELKDDVASIKKRQQEEQHTLDAHDLQFKKLKQRIA